MIIRFNFLQHSLLEHDNLISFKCFVTFRKIFQVIIIEYHEFEIFRGNNYLPSMIF